MKILVMKNGKGRQFAVLDETDKLYICEPYNKNEGYQCFSKDRQGDEYKIIEANIEPGDFVIYTAPGSSLSSIGIVSSIEAEYIFVWFTASSSTQGCKHGTLTKLVNAQYIKETSLGGNRSTVL